MPDIETGSSEPTIGQSYAQGYWMSENCDNSLAAFPSSTDFSWGSVSFNITGCDNDNYVEMRILKQGDYSVLQSVKFTENGRKEIDLSQYSNIPSTQDVRIMFLLTSYV